MKPAIRPLRPCGSPGAMRGQSGLGTVELLLAGFLSFTLVGTVGWMFRHQVHEYFDIREQARVQSGLLLALQSMTLEIANAGAMLPNPRESFSAQSARFSFAYIDLSGRSCPAGSKASITYRISPVGSTDRIVQDIACDGRLLPARVLATASRGKLRLAFRYYDKLGVPTANPGQVHAVDLEISLQTAGPKAGSTFFKTRAQTVRIQCPNL